MKLAFNVSVLVTCLFLAAASSLSQEWSQEWVQPHFFTGNDLLNSCQNAEGICLGYITGVVDASTSTNIHGVLSNGKYVLPLCLPDSLANNKIVADIVVKSMKDHPERLKNPAATVVQGALQDFGCKNGWPEGIIPPEKKKS